MARVINDLHYDGKTVEQRLDFDGLLPQFHVASEARDATRMLELLEDVAIARPWATRLISMLLDGPSQPPIHLNLDDPRNAGALRKRNELHFPPCMRPVQSPRDPYMNLGSHPDIVDSLWNKLGAALPED